MAIEVTSFFPDTLDRMVRAVELVKDRLRRAAAALNNAGVPYAIVGGNAVAAWVTQVDPAAVRNTRDVDIAIRREDFDRTKAALEAAGFIHHHLWGIDCFLDGPTGRAREAVHLLFANEKVKPLDPVPFPDVDAAPMLEHARILPLASLVTAKLTSFRDKDRAHLRDMIELAMIDANWLHGLPPELATRLKLLLDTPE